ncbi:TetR family transcriptional regulator [Clostridium sp.]|uniref:TetR family transcriptional regulator n=1 Tax=Clostridium sp. TaxID=1506 RepID=UPI003D6CEC6B
MKKGVINLPTETFSNLSVKKKNKIIEAIKNEFARVPYEKVSINKIVQDADISRGSFYMYFEDKKDTMSCVLSTYHDELMFTIKESINQNKGNIFAVFNEVLEFTAKFGTAKENIAFCMNIFSNQTAQNEILLQFENRSKRKDYFDWFKQYVDTKSLNLQSINDIYDTIDILIAVTQKATMDIFLHIEEKDEIIKEYKNKITILQRGMLKESL